MSRINHQTLCINRDKISTTDLIIQDQSEHCYRCVVQQYPLYKWHDTEPPPWYREYWPSVFRVCQRLYLRGDLDQIREFIHTCNYSEYIYVS